LNWVIFYGLKPHFPVLLDVPNHIFQFRHIPFRKKTGTPEKIADDIAPLCDGYENIKNICARNGAQLMATAIAKELLTILEKNTRGKPQDFSNLRKEIAELIDKLEGEKVK
jgi:hypothetical protein